MIFLQVLLLMLIGLFPWTSVKKCIDINYTVGSSYSLFYNKIDRVAGPRSQQRNSGIVFLAAKSEVKHGDLKLRIIDGVRLKVKKIGNDDAFIALPAIARNQALQGNLDAVPYVLGVTLSTQNVPVTIVKTRRRTVTFHNGLFLFNADQKSAETCASSTNVGVTVDTTEYSPACRIHKLLQLTVMFSKQVMYQFKVPVRLALEQAKERCPSGHVSASPMGRFLSSGILRIELSVAVRGDSLNLIQQVDFLVRNLQMSSLRLMEIQVWG